MNTATIDQYLQDCRRRGLAPATMRDYQCFLHKWIKYATLMKAETADAILDFFGFLKCSDRGKANYWRVLRAFYRRAFALGLVEMDITMGLRPRFVKARIRKPPTPEQVFHIIDSIAPPNSFARHRDQVLFTTLFYTGGRLGEALSLTKNDIDRSGDYWTATLLGKGNRVRLILIVEPLREVLEGWWPRLIGNFLFPPDHGHDAPANLCHVSHRWRMYQRNIGIDPPWRTHDLRHGCATHLFDKGVDLSIIQSILGHSTIEVTQGYARMSTRRRRFDMEAAFKPPDRPDGGGGARVISLVDEAS